MNDTCVNVETYYLVEWSDSKDAEMARYKFSVVTTAHLSEKDNDRVFQA